MWKNLLQIFLIKLLLKLNYTLKSLYLSACVYAWNTTKMKLTKRLLLLLLFCKK